MNKPILLVCLLALAACGGGEGPTSPAPIPAALTASATPAPTPTPAPSPTPEPTPGTEPTPAPSPTPGPTPAPTPTPAPVTQSIACSVRQDGADPKGTGTYWLLSWSTTLEPAKVSADWDVPITCSDNQNWTSPGTSGTWRFLVSTSPCGGRPTTVRAWLPTGERCSVNP